MPVNVSNSFLESLFPAPGEHISVFVMYDYWFRLPLSAKEQDFVDRHLETCAACRERREKYRQRFPDRQKPIKRKCN